MPTRPVGLPAPLPFLLGTTRHWPASAHAQALEPSSSHVLSSVPVALSANQLVVHAPCLDIRGIGTMRLSGRMQTTCALRRGCGIAKSRVSCAHWNSCPFVLHSTLQKLAVIFPARLPFCLLQLPQNAPSSSVLVLGSDVCHPWAVHALPRCSQPC